jgi:hypothetical protein
MAGFIGLTAAQAAGAWQFASIRDYHAAYLQQNDGSGFALYAWEGREIWACVKLPDGSPAVDFRRPMSIQIDGAPPLAVSRDVYQPDTRAVFWQAAPPGGGAFLSRLMAGGSAVFRCHDAYGRPMGVRLTLSGSRAAIGQVLAQTR